MTIDQSQVGVHLKNKKQQDRAMKQFVAGDIEAGEMGCGIELQNVNPFVQKIKDDMYQGQGFDEYISEHLGEHLFLTDIFDSDDLFSSQCEPQFARQKR